MPRAVLSLKAGGLHVLTERAVGEAHLGGGGTERQAPLSLLPPPAQEEGPQSSA